EVPAALRVAPFDGVKLDGALLRAALTEPRTAQVVTALARLARRLGARVIASSVETKAQLALARRVGCTEAQGFLLGAPIAPESFSVVARGQHAMQEKHASARKDHHPKPRADATHRRQFKSPQTEAGGACADSQHMQHICEVRGESD
ncbi:MAG: EAL domain-containing protein, partial [Burkholderiaceae bacterium]|nr:EAL domain-containing protein [Burkholderiaceae bacterium]